jgi:hypothetical protein
MDILFHGYYGNIVRWVIGFCTDLGGGYLLTLGVVVSNKVNEVFDKYKIFKLDVDLIMVRWLMSRWNMERYSNSFEWNCWKDMSYIYFDSDVNIL